MTANKNIMADINRVFNYLEQPTNIKHLRACQTLLVSPTGMRRQLATLINKEIKAARSKKPAGITLKLNSLSDQDLIYKLYDAARSGVEIKLIIRGICCILTRNKKFKKPITGISIIDEYLEHARVMIFHNEGKEKVFISSADWMVRNIDHRIEVACPILEKHIREELKDILDIQLSDNVKARILDNKMENDYVRNGQQHTIRSQIETYNYLFQKQLKESATGSN